MELLSFLSPNSLSGVMVFILGFLLTVYFNIKVYQYNK